MSETVNDYDDLLEDAEHRWRNRLIGLVVLAALVAAGGEQAQGLRGLPD